jgi:hypothetical protein
MIDQNSPEFKICCYYALKNINKNIDLKIFGNYFCFFQEKADKDKGFGYERRRPIF